MQRSGGLCHCTEDRRAPRQTEGVRVKNVFPGRSQQCVGPTAGGLGCLEKELTHIGLEFGFFSFLPMCWKACLENTTLFCGSG